MKTIFQIYLTLLPGSIAGTARGRRRGHGTARKADPDSIPIDIQLDQLTRRPKRVNPVFIEKIKHDF